MISIIPYTPDDSKCWDDVVTRSRNGIFQHYRAYMDYHSDRFTDCSIMAADSHGRIIAVLPANAEGTTVFSHHGLSFGGWLMTPDADMNRMMEVWQAMEEYYREKGFKEIIYRPSPYVYHRYPAEEDIYAIFRANGRLDSCQVSTVIDLNTPLPYNSNARRGENSAMASGIVVSLDDDWSGFWALLNECLAERHDAKPVHTLDEINLLRSRFPRNIELYTARSTDGKLVGGVVMYITDVNAHCQYIATNADGREAKVLPLLFSHIIAVCAKRGIRYFDFGTSNLDGGKYLNEGLVRQKCGFGGRAVVYNSYKIEL